MFKKGPLTKLAANPSTSSILRASKKLDKQLMIEPEWDEISNNMAMAMVINKREIAEAVQEHDRMCEEAKIAAKDDEKSLKQLRTMQADLRMKFIETNNFINDCRAKCKVLEGKIAAETETEQKLQKEFDDMEEKMQSLTEFHEKELKPSVEELSVYEKVLDEIVNDMDIFESRQDFFDRIDALLLVRKETTDNATLEELEKIQADIVKLSNEGNLVIAGLENQLDEMEKIYEQKKKELLKWESVLAPTNDVIANKEKETFMMMDQIQQMYLLLCERNGIEPKFKREQIEEQLDYIKNELEMIVQIIEMAGEMVDLETLSNVAEHGSAKSGIPRK